MEIKRGLTNLAVRKDLQLPKNQLKKGFLYVFNRGFKGSEYLFMNRLWVTAILPFVASDPRFGKVKNFNVALKRNALPALARYTKVTKELMADIPHFTVQVPVYHRVGSDPREILNEVRHFFFAADAVAQQPSLAPQVPDVQDTGSQPLAPVHDPLSGADIPQEIADAISGKEPTPQYQEVDLGTPPAGAERPKTRTAFIRSDVVLRQATWMSSDAKTELGESFLGVKVEAHAGAFLISLVFKISQAEAQQLTSTPWVAIRNIDIYPLVHSWVLSQYGAKGRPLLSSFPISLIAKTLPPEHSAPENLRIDANGIAISTEGLPILLPREVNNCQRYEDLYGQAGSIEGDPSFAYGRMGNDKATNLPSNIPVLMDWQNLKFAYTNTNGVLTTLDMTRFIPCDAAHATELLGRVLSTSYIEKIENLAKASATPTTMAQYATQEDVDALNKYIGENAEGPQAQTRYTLESLRVNTSLTSYFGVASRIFEQTHGEQAQLTIRELLPSGFPAFAPVFRFFERLYADVTNNMDAVYAKYSVAYTIATMGWVALVVRYGKNYGETSAEAAALTKAARDQKVDPDWEMPSVPLLSDKIGLLPHQKKVRNLLKDSPQFAILPVQAGGGKTPLALIDILLEIKANRSAPYLILCPGHLVPQYVKEIVYFTSGKLNVIPITSYAISTSGYPRILEMLKAAPRNTVVVANYDVLRFRAVNLVYGTTPVAVYPVIEFLRQFHFGYVLLDESHSVKNKSGRTAATLNLIADIPKKRLASGTMAHDSPSDLAIQVGMLDPTLFGGREQFNNTYGMKVSGDRVIEWIPNAAQLITNKIKSRVVIAGAMRKEWAALLPQPIEKILRVDLTEAQQAVYQSVLEKTLDDIKEAAKSNAELAKFVNGEANPESESEDEASSESIENMLRPYLARLESYITAPARDPLGDKLLSGDDRISPKVRVIAERIRDHIQQGLEGKVLIFTNYTAVAEEIFAQMPDDLKESGILYTAAEKVECGAAFENNSKKKWMVGVENSMNTGLNLQYCSRLIREACVWNPGTLEQGNSRVNRPELKKADRRDYIYYDWIVANHTIDVTKISRLISKIVAIAKFENPNSGEYQAIKDVPVVAMNLANILEYNSWDSNLKEYFLAYKDYKQVQQNDYKEYRDKHGELSLAPVAAAPTPEDAKLLKRVPYVPGLDLYGAADLGLIRADEYARLDANDDEEEEGGGDSDSDDSGNGEDSGNAEAERVKALFKDKMVHTEHGDGIVTRVALATRRLVVRLNTGYVVRTRFANTFVVTRQETSTKDIRNQLLKQVGEMDVATPVDVPALRAKPVTLTQKEIREQKRLEEQKRKELEKQGRKGKKVKPVEEEQAPVLAAELTFSVSNGFLGITYEGEQGDVQQALEALGFRPTPPFYYAEVKTPKHLVKQFNVWEAAGFTLDKKLGHEISQAFRNMHKLMSGGNLHNHRLNYKFSMSSKLKNFFRTEFKASNEPNVIKPFPMIEDGSAYIVLPMRGQTGTLQAIQHKAPGVRWARGPASMIYFCSSTQKVAEVLQLVLRNGIQISNIDDLRKDFNKIRKAQFRADDDLNDMEV